MPRVPLLRSLSLLPLVPFVALAGFAAEPAIPYAWRNVKIGGGGFVTGVAFHPTQRGLAYARTDVGGAYRWVLSDGGWTPLTDWIDSDDVNLLGIESLAVDPQDPDRVYFAAGTYNQPKHRRGAILASADRGRTFTRADLPFHNGGNEAGRGNGERLAVDPSDGRVLFFGSRDRGLWRSADRGATWSRVESFPAIATSPAAHAGAGTRWPQAVGIVFVVFDPAGETAGQPTRTLYAGVSTTEPSLYASRDAGETWAALAGAPAGLRPTRAARAGDGTFYFSYGDEAGPNTMRDGAVWKFSPERGEWTDVTPLRGDRKPNTGFGYGAVAVDPRCPTAVLASTFCRWDPGDEIFRSTDGGKTWRPVLAGARFDHAKAPWTAHVKPHWIASLAIDPFDSNHVLFTTGYGVWTTYNLTAADHDQPVAWSFDDDGLEETVPLALASPPAGAPLLSAIGDIDGFRHDDLAKATLQYAAPPRFTNGEDITFAALRPEYLVRIGTLRRRTTEVRAAVSRDGGTTWTALASEPPGCGGAGKAAVSADGTTIVWTPRGIAAPGAPSRSATPLPPFFTTDEGKTWTACRGVPDGTRVVADPTNAKIFYTLDLATGALLVSDDGAAHFVKRGALPAVPPPPADWWSPPDAVLRPVAGSPGELWIASRTAGLLHSADGGATLVRTGPAEKVLTLGLGCPAPRSTAPTLFIAGTVGGETGVFRSDDRGLSWSRIDDAANRLGLLHELVGDPRVYGRVYATTGGRGILVGEPR